MGDRGNPDWTQTLGEVEAAIHDCLSALDRYESRFGELLGEAARSARHASHEPIADAGWQARLAAAAAEADAADKLLAEQEAVWNQWQESLAAWQRDLQRMS